MPGDKIQIGEAKENSDELELGTDILGGIDRLYFPIQDGNLERLCEIASYWRNTSTESTAIKINRFIATEAKTAINHADSSISDVSKSNEELADCSYASCKIVTDIYGMSKKSSDNRSKEFERLLKRTWPNDDKYLTEIKVPTGFLGKFDKKKVKKSGSGDDYDPEEDNGKQVADAREKAAAFDIPQTLANWRGIDGFGRSGPTERINHLGVREISFYDMAASLPEVLKDMQDLAKKAGVARAPLHLMKRKAVKECISRAAADLDEAANQASYIASMFYRYDRVPSNKEPPNPTLKKATQMWPGIVSESVEFGQKGTIKKMEKDGTPISDDTFYHTYDVMWEVVNYCLKLLNDIATAAGLFGNTNDVQSALTSDNQEIKKSMLESIKSASTKVDSERDSLKKFTTADDNQKNKKTKDSKKIKRTVEKRNERIEKNNKRKTEFNPVFGGGIKQWRLDEILNKPAIELIKTCITLLKESHSDVTSKNRSKPKGEEHDADDNKKTNRLTPTGYSGDYDDFPEEQPRHNNIFNAVGNGEIAWIPEFTGAMVVLRPELVFRKNEDFSEEKFVKNEDFSNEVFEKIEDFSEFGDESLLKNLNLSEEKFAKNEDFSEEKFAKNEDFSNEVFEKIEDFSEFGDESLLKNLNLSEEKFAKTEDFSNEVFEKIEDFSEFGDESLLKNMVSKEEITLIKDLQKNAPFKKDRSYLDMADRWSILRAIFTTAGTLIRDVTEDIRMTDSINDYGELYRKLYSTSEKMLKIWIRDGNKEVGRLTAETEEYDEKFESRMKKFTDKKYHITKRELSSTNRRFKMISGMRNDETEKTNETDIEENYEEEMLYDKIDDTLEELEFIKTKLDRKEPLLAGKKNSRFQKATKENPKDIILASRMSSGNREILRMFFMYLSATGRFSNPRDIFSGKKYETQRTAFALSFWRN